MLLCNYLIFPADVWGTVSDWVMVGVTAVTGWLVWQTLKSQTKVQELQEKATRIEMNRYITEVKPEIEFKLIAGSGDFYEPGKYIAKNWRFLFTVKKNEMVGVKLQIKSNCTQCWTYEAIPFEYNILVARDIIEIKADYLGASPNEKDEYGKSIMALAFQFEFSDIIGNRYVQYFDLDHENYEFKTTSTSPFFSNLNSNSII